MKAIKNQGFVLWLMGPTSCGKTTIAKLLTTHLAQLEKPVLHFDGDEIRGFWGPDLGFESSDRLRVVSTLIYLANKASKASINVVVSALTANKDARDLISHDLSPLIVYISCSIETCSQRDPKGLYAMAQDGLINTLIGFNSRYLPPSNPDLIIDSEKIMPDEAVVKIAGFLRDKGYL